MLTTNQKGLTAETAIVHECVRRGIGVARPLDDERYDLILDLHPRLVRVQCKTAACNGDVLVVHLYSARRTANGLRRTLYSADEIDAFAAHSPETGKCYFFEFDDLTCRSEFRLRLRPTRNNQSKRVRWARDFEFGAKLKDTLGP
jgi:hypothetical protein